MATKKKSTKLLYGSLIITVFIAFGAYLATYHVLPYMIIKPLRNSESITPKDLGLQADNLDIKTDSSITLKGYYIYSLLDTPKGVMIIVHGIGSCKEHQLSQAGDLAQMGIETVIYDSRAHGESTGKYCSYGYHEKKDISAIVDLIEKKSPNLKIGIWGNSLGGAMAIQALEYDKRIQFGVIESTFTDLHQITFDYKKRLFKGFGVRWYSDFVLGIAAKKADFNPNDVKPIESVKHIEQPMFMAHGKLDESISYEYGVALYDSLKSKNKTLELVENAGHFSLYKRGDKEYSTKVLDFIENQFIQ